MLKVALLCYKIKGSLAVLCGDVMLKPSAFKVDKNANMNLIMV